ncbi:MAG: LacI family DNA-binding transcriptional regulator [Marinovum algicola]|uniref:Transcriptional regulator, LacI family n=1 Tax=Marinovum algicola TaxID=42444 RepID=A0A975W6T5_9RHOB|nr:MULTISPECIES: LacI family DNA-binding transcriptional regulator [Marinovum]MDD9742773.1 LacI family DNA-binding transcriptional regulator [Marinovum sp. PR37]SEI61146.1 transcriptional regulator, LacI family [Marinovum algicola]SLN26145.1 Catabolite control protein A [Marinovum algicola]
MATIYDVAKLAGVSPKTVSRVLNGDAPVNEKTRTKVARAISELGYVPSQAARMMRSSRSGLIGLITGAISATPHGTETRGLPDMLIVQAIQREMAERGKILMIADTGGSPSTVPMLAATFAQHRVEGLIYVADHHRAVDLDLSGANCPTLLTNCYDDRGTPCVLPDDAAGQQALVARLIAAGHRRIGFLTLDQAMPAGRLRLEGYKAALAEAGLPYDPVLVEAGYVIGREMQSAALTEALEHLLTLDQPPSVICCGNDEMAMRVYGLLRSRGLRVPEDISVAGYDDHRSIAEMLHPHLTTVELPYIDMGRHTAARLLDMIGGDVPASDDPLLVQGPVVWRSSVTALTEL